MNRRSNATLIAVLAATFVSVACTDQSPLGPNPGSDGLRMSVQGVPGSYVISFLKETNTGLAPAADEEPTGTFLVLKSEIRDAAGNLAQSGYVTYEYCAVKGDYAPSASCLNGSGGWKRLVAPRFQVDAVGSLLGFGSCSTPRTIGFRVTYTGGRSGISNGVSDPRDFSWF
jgi:hypothetical protein